MEPCWDAAVTGCDRCQFEEDNQRLFAHYKEIASHRSHTLINKYDGWTFSYLQCVYQNAKCTNVH